MHDRLANILCITSYSYNYDEDRYLGVSKSQSGEHEVQNCQKKKHMTMCSLHPFTLQHRGVHL